MLNYSEFKEQFKEQFTKAMGTEYEGWYVEDTTVNKNGVDLDGFTFKNDEDNGGKPIARPVFYYNDLYRDYSVQGADIDDLADSVANGMVNALEKAKTLIPNNGISRDKIKDNVIFDLVSPKNIRENTPHREFLDLVVGYRWLVDTDGTGVSSAVIDNGLMEYCGLTEEELYEYAMANTNRLLKPNTRSLASMVRDIYISENEDADGEFLDGIDDEATGGTLVVSNSYNFRGATTILNPSYLAKISEKVKGDFYVLPSSIHEVLVLPVAVNDNIDSLRSMVADVNANCVSENDYLSDSVYIYHAEEGTLSIA